MKIVEKIEKIKATHGEWTAHNIKLSENISTMDKGTGERYAHRADVYKSLTNLGLNKPISRLEILDLGCLEGGISIEFAKEGAKTTGIDIRDAHLAKADVCAEVLKLKTKCRWIQGDVTDKTLWSKLGKYDVIILSGLLYHLDIKDIFPLLKNLRQISKTKGMLIVDTNITSKYLESASINENLTVWGRTWKEHSTGDSLKDRISRAWSSLSNNNAFWLTERSLVNVLVSAGFTYVYKPLYPYHEWAHKNRDIWVALPGKAKDIVQPLREDPDNRPIEHPGFK